MLISRIGSYYYYDLDREQQILSYFKKRAITIAQQLKSTNQVPDADKEDVNKILGSMLLSEHIKVFDSKDEVIFDSSDEPLPITSQLLAQVRDGLDVKVRQGDLEIILIRYVHQPNQPPWVVAYASELNVLNRHDRLRDVLAIGWLISLILVSFAGWLFARDVFKPVADITNQVNNISAGNLNKRLTIGPQKDELSDLAQTFNLMLNRLEQAFTAQKNFVSHASHELRTPLAVIMGEVEVTLLKERSPAAYEESLTRVLNEVRNLNDVVNGLLELARAESGTSGTFQKVRIDEVLWDSQAQVLHKNPEYKVEIRYEKIPDNVEELQLMGDETLLRTAFTNLMDNACKYSGNHRVEVLLEVGADTLSIHFQDQGVGISEEQLPQLFNTFYRGSTAQNTPGYGIGLALVKRIIDIHQGQIHITSQPGTGSTFTVKLPLF
ncbi:HAMP domain-containing sensor histidine kinase [Telluribacter sp. SYSU D00476]|uniref:HAMP domain-containing sensor histidine kinase n=1 Tax=Telluribacter sp. SYSU D00476 TaxID=2811430 RepID=UPI001FF2807F|nr:HAMP domain-containing sensor histidine kinase [Telluribacter sp. SYSU D00476]